MLINITFLMIFCGFWSVAVNTVDKLQFLVLIGLFAVLLSKLCNVLLCSYEIYLSKFFDSQDSDFPTHKMIRLSKITRRWGPICITVPNFMKIGQKVAEIWRLNSFQNGGRLPSWFFWNSNVLKIAAVERPILHHGTKFCNKRSNRRGDIATFVIFKMTAAAILDFRKFEILMVGLL